MGTRRIPKVVVYEGMHIVIDSFPFKRGKWSAISKVCPSRMTLPIHELTSRTNGHPNASEAEATALELAKSAIRVYLEVRLHME
jgi:hypothetical protein